MGRKHTVFGPDPRNTAWTQDKKRFGYSMMQRMGWQEGQGLGSDGRKKGRAEPVKVVVKQDNKGIGATVQSANAETRKQTMELNEVLARLARAATPPPPPKEEEQDGKKQESASGAAAEAVKRAVSPEIGSSARGCVRFATKREGEKDSKQTAFKRT